MQRFACSIACSVACAIGLLLCAAACGPSTHGTGDDDDAADSGLPSTCSGATTRCDGLTYQNCVDGHFVDVATCNAPQICAPSFGCADCDPGRPQTCVGDDTYVCNDNGTVGGFVASCPFETCLNGFCQGDDGCSEEAKLIYVIDDQYRLLSFNPAMDMNTFTLLGPVNCPTAYPSWPDWGNPGAPTPFSMGVDRTGRAWVVYTSGEIFHVTTTAPITCTATPFPRGTSGYELFGMAFVSDTIGSDAEHLYISGGPAANPGSGNLGMIDPANPTSITTKGGLPQAENSPELSGTGNAELYAYYPGTSQTFVAQLDKNTAQIVPGKQWNVTPLDGQVYAWAFAHWGGRFYIFVTDQDLFGTKNSRVYRLDPATGQVDLLLQNQPYYIVGAGVSTCAPVVIE